jgi:hypothetical protein
VPPTTARLFRTDDSRQGCVVLFIVPIGQFAFSTTSSEVHDTQISYVAFGIVGVVSNAFQLP